MAKTTQQRRNEIYRIIVSQGSARVSELAEQLQVTTETIRKDLNCMDEQGIIIKNHGGAEIKNTY
ncbi:DeoR family transcriptional regulator, partial [Erysipelatoclostridium ramosum]